MMLEIFVHASTLHFGFQILMFTLFIFKGPGEKLSPINHMKPANVLIPVGL